MSWSFEHNGKDKEALKRACHRSLDQSARHSGEAGVKLIEQVKAVVALAIDAAVKPPSADYQSEIFRARQRVGRVA